MESLSEIVFGEREADYYYVFYFRTRPSDPEVSNDALRQQQVIADKIRARVGASHVLAEFTEVEFAKSDEGRNEPKPQLVSAIDMVRAAHAEGFLCRLAILRVDAIGTGEEFQDDVARLAPDFAVRHVERHCWTGADMERAMEEKRLYGVPVPDWILKEIEACRTAL